MLNFYKEAKTDNSTVRATNVGFKTWVLTYADSLGKGTQSRKT
jgi:hypothetical protein